MKIKLNNVRCSYPKIHKPEATNGGAPRFGVDLVVEIGSEADLAIREAINTTMQEVLREKATARRKEWEGQKNNWCYRKSTNDEHDGCMILAARAQRNSPPTLLRKTKAETLGNPVTEDNDPFYPGCLVNAIVEIWVQTGTNSGVRCGFKGLQFAGDAPAFTASRPASLDDFEDVSDGADAASFA